MRNFTDLSPVFPLGFLNSGLGFYREGSQKRFLGLQRGKGRQMAVFRDTGKEKPKGGQVLGTLSIIMIMKAGNAIYNHVSNKLSWRILYSQHGVLEENGVTLHVCRSLFYLSLLGFLISQSLSEINLCAYQSACLSLKFILTSMDIGGENGHRFSLSQLNCQSVYPPSFVGGKLFKFLWLPGKWGDFQKK